MNFSFFIQTLNLFSLSLPLQLLHAFNFALNSNWEIWILENRNERKYEKIYEWNDYGNAKLGQQWIIIKVRICFCCICRQFEGHVFAPLLLIWPIWTHTISYSFSLMAPASTHGSFLKVDLRLPSSLKAVDRLQTVLIRFALCCLPHILITAHWLCCCTFLPSVTRNVAPFEEKKLMLLVLKVLKLKNHFHCCFAASSFPYWPSLPLEGECKFYIWERVSFFSRKKILKLKLRIRQ